MDVALDALWEDMDSFLPLLKLLPALKFEKKDYRSEYVCANVHVFRFDMTLIFL